MCFYKGVDGVEQFRQVVLFVDGFGVVLGEVLLPDARAADDVGGQGVGVEGVLRTDEGVHHVAEGFELATRALVDVERILVGVFHYVPHACVGPVGGEDDLLDGGVADAAARTFDAALEGFFVAVVDDEAEVRHDVAYLGMVVEGVSGIDAVRDGAFQQAFLEDAALGIGAVKDGHLAVGCSLRPMEPADAVAYDFAFFHIAEGYVELQGVTLFVPAEYFLFYLALVAGDKAVGGLDDVLGRAVVLFEFKELGPAIYFGELQDIVDLCAPEAVDALRVVAHDADVLVSAGELVHDAVLNGIGVLILVDEDEMEPLRIFFEHFGMVFKQEVGVEQEVVKVHGVGPFHPLHIELVDESKLLHVVHPVALPGFGIGRVVIGQHHGVLGLRDAAAYDARFVFLVVELHFLEQVFHQALRVVRLIDGVTLGEAQEVGFVAQDAVEDGVERTHPERPGLVLPDEGGYSLLHLVGRLVGKGQGQDVPRRHALLQQVGNLVSQHPCLAGTGSGYHQGCAIVVFNSLALLFV